MIKTSNLIKAECKFLDFAAAVEKIDYKKGIYFHYISGAYPARYELTDHNRRKWLIKCTKKAVKYYISLYPLEARLDNFFSHIKLWKQIPKWTNQTYLLNIADDGNGDFTIYGLLIEILKLLGIATNIPKKAQKEYQTDCQKYGLI